MRYDYWVVRYVPDVVRGEYVNLAVIAGHGSDWAVRRVSNLQRASRLGGSATVTHAFLDRIEASISLELDAVEALIELPREQASRGFVEDLRIRMNNTVQISAPRPIRAQTADDAADIAFELMVVDHGPVVRHRSRTLVARRLQRAFEEAPDLSNHVARARQARVDGQRIDYDVAVTDGVTVQMSQAWAFDLKDLSRLETNIQAWNYLMGLVRQHGGELVRSRSPEVSRVRIPRDVSANAIYRTPTSNEGKRQLKIALGGWANLGIRAVQEDDAETVVEQARTLILA